MYSKDQQTLESESAIPVLIILLMALELSLLS